MKKLLSTLLFLAVCFTSMQARTFVLITGVSNYDDPRNNLSQTTKDATRFKEVMETQTKDITFLTSRNVTKANVLEKLRAICNRAQAEDQVVFYYSGHGMAGGMCAFDTTIPYSELVNVLKSSKAGAKICYIDACHAGSAADNLNSKDWTNTVKDNSNIAFFVGCRPEETSIESQFLGAGLFTQALINGLSGKSDKNGDKKVTVEELFKYIYGDVLMRTQKIGHQQHPQLIAPKSMYNIVLRRWK